MVPTFDGQHSEHKLAVRESKVLVWERPVQTQLDDVLIGRFKGP